MRTHSTSRDALHRLDSALVGADSRTSAHRSASIHWLNSPTRPGQNRSFVRSTQAPPALRNEIAELQADIDGLPILVRLVVNDIPAGTRSDSIPGGADIHKLLSSTLEKMVDRIRGSSLRNDDPSKHPLAAVELISTAENLIRLQAQLNETVLRIGSLELDLVDRAAKRGDRKIELRPREFQLLKYMMQRNDELLTRATLFKEVWHYKFVPDTNLVDVHMGRLRRKIDGANETPMIRNVRGVGFVLTAGPLSQRSPVRPV
jgi:DNA-binding winged helix-turn-helix (wHTH) protein